jgi:hypothetical protein
LFIVNTGGVQLFRLERSVLFASERSRTSYSEKPFIKQAPARTLAAANGIGTFVAISVTALRSDPKNNKKGVTCL